MIKFDANNFRILENAQLYDDTPMSVVLGYNEDGKTSLLQAMKFLLTGEAYGRRGKNVTALIRHGETKMSLRMILGGLVVQRTQATGDTLASIAARLQVPVDVLPVLFDARMAGDGGNKALKAFLDNVASTRFNALAHFAADDKIRPCIEGAIRSGKSSTKQVVDYCESMRAMSRPPAAPIQPVMPNPAPSAAVAAQALVATTRAAAGELTDQLNEAVKLGQDLAAIVQHRTAVASWEVAKAAASVGDPIGDVRSKLEKVVGVNVNTLSAMSAIVGAAGFQTAEETLNQARQHTLNAVTEASATLASNPLPPSVGAAPVLGDSATKTLTSIGATIETAALSQLSMAVASATATLTSQKAAAEAQNAAAEAALTTLLRAQGAWGNYEVATDAYTTDVAKAAAEWSMWDHAAKGVAFAADQHTAATGDSFGTLVAEMSVGLLQGRSVKIDPEHGIFLGPEAIGDLSESTRWRTEIAVMAAVARSCKSPLLLIDGADILDSHNRGQLFDWLALHITPHFQHTIVTATCRGSTSDEKPLASTKACKFLLTKGQLTKLG